MAYVRVLPVAAGDAPAIGEYNQLADNMEALKALADMQATPMYTEHAVLIGAADGSITEVVLGAGAILVGTANAPVCCSTPRHHPMFSNLGTG